MILAAYGSSLYKLLFLGHMIAFVVAFAPAVINPVLMAKTKADGDTAARGRLVEHLASKGLQILLPALVVLGGFGIALVLEGDWDFGDTWVSLAFLVWLGLGGVVTGLLMPNERKLAAGDAAAERLVDRGGQLVTLLVLVMLYLMIWKPGA